MDYNEMLFALQIHREVDQALREDAARQHTDIESFATPERYEEYVMRTVRRVATVADIVKKTPLDRAPKKSFLDV